MGGNDFFNKPAFQKFLRNKSHSATGGKIKQPLPYKGMRALVPPASKARDFKFAVFDIETEDWVKFLLLGFFDGESYHEFDSVRKFLDFLFTSKYRYYRVFAHFGGHFDFNFIIEELDMMPDYSYEVMSGQGISELKVIHRKNPDMNWSFRDSYKLLPMSLEKLTKSFDVAHKKQEIDYKNITKDWVKLRKYLEYDCRGLYEVIMKFKEWFKKYDVQLMATLASQSMRTFQTTLKEPILCLPPNIEKFVRRSYFGGRVEIFKLRAWGKVYMYDVNSLYPYVMLNYPIPVGKAKMVMHFDREHAGFYQAKIKLPDSYIPPLPFVQKGKLLFPGGQIDGCFTSMELEMAEMMGCEVTATYGCIFNTNFIFKDFIEDMYDKKKNAEDTTTKMIAKLIMNSCYGKWGQNRNKEKIVKCRTIQESLGLVAYDQERGLYKVPTESKATFIIPSIASWITSCARYELFTWLNSIGDEHIYYCDTDSVVTDVPIPTGKEIGEMKLENEGTEAIFLLPKLYAIREKDTVKIRAKGFDPAFIKTLSFCSFEKALGGDTRDFKQAMRRFAGLKESLKRNGQFVSMVDSVKSIQSKYSKRKIIGGYDTEAWKLKTWR